MGIMQQGRTTKGTVLVRDFKASALYPLTILKLTDHVYGYRDKQRLQVKL
jgi:hypothetical protein